MKKNCALLTVTLAVVFFAAGCSSPRYSNSRSTSSACSNGKSACGGYTRVTSR